MISDDDGCYFGKVRLGSWLLAALVAYRKNRRSDFVQTAEVIKKILHGYSKETEILNYYASSIKAKLGILALNSYFLSEQLFYNDLTLSFLSFFKKKKSRSGSGSHCILNQSAKVYAALF